MINDQAGLSAWLPLLKAATWIAIDTEADSLHAYPEKLCLLQVSLPAGNVLVDPLAGLDLVPVLAEMSRHELILHGGDYDLRMLRKDLDFVPARIFDTMLASRLLGVREFGLLNLMDRFLGVKLEKGPQKANWARRPLTARMEEYALNDVAYLKPLSDLLRDQLRAKGRLAWHEEACARLISENSHVPPPDPDLVWRIKGSRHLPGRSLSVLREIWQWREKEAIEANRPPYFILSSEAMIALAAHSNDGSKSLEQMIPRHLTPRRQRGLLESVQRGRKSGPVPSTPRRRPPPPTEASKVRYAELEKVRDRRAQDLGIDPTLIASRATLVMLSQEWDKFAPELMSWQRELLT